MCKATIQFQHQVSTHHRDREGILQIIQYISFHIQSARVKTYASVERKSYVFGPYVVPNLQFKTPEFPANKKKTSI